MSVLATDRPRVLSPGKSAAVKIAVEEPGMLDVSPAWLSDDDLKSEAVTVAGFLQGKPLMKVFGSGSVAVGQVSWRLSLASAMDR